MKAFQWCDFEWDPLTFPDPEGMIRRLKAKGLKICVWINPYIGQKSPVFKELQEKGYLLNAHRDQTFQFVGVPFAGIRIGKVINRQTWLPFIPLP